MACRIINGIYADGGVQGLFALRYLGKRIADMKARG